MFLKRLNAEAERRLAEVNLLRCFGKMARFVQGQEMFKLMKIGQCDALIALKVN